METIWFNFLSNISLSTLHIVNSLKKEIGERNWSWPALYFDENDGRIEE